MTIPGVRTLAHAELGTRPSSVMRRPWKRARPRDHAPPPRGTPVVHGDARAQIRSLARLSAIGWSLLLATQLIAGSAAGAGYLLVTASEPEPVADALALVPLVARQHRRPQRRPRRAPPARPAVPVPERPTMDAVLDAVSNQTDGAHACMQDAIDRGDLVRGTSYRFNLDWVITPSGSVASPQVAAPPGIPAAVLRPCLSRAMEDWRFPASQRGVNVRRFPFHFTVR